MVGQAPTISLSMCSSEWVSTCFFSSFREANKNTLPVKTYAYTYVYIYIQVAQDQTLHLTPEEINDHQTAKLAIYKLVGGFNPFEKY